MKTRALSLVVALAFSVMLICADEVAFNRVTVVDVVAGRLVPDQLVRISGERILEVVPSAGAPKPRATRVVDAAGKFLIPGLWDMHTTSTSTPRVAPR